MTTLTLEEVLQAEFMVVENQVGHGKIIYNELTNESIITNGKSLITYKNIKLQESDVTAFEKERIVQLTNNIIHYNVGATIDCEFYFYKEDLKELKYYINEYKGESIKLTFNEKLNVVLASIENSPSLVKILQTIQINKHKHSNASVVVEASQLEMIVRLIEQSMMDGDIVGFALQSSTKLLLIETFEVSACISCI